MRTDPHQINGESRLPASLIADLKKLGFTEYEARTYLTLLEDYPATAYEVGKRGGLLRANVYSALEALDNRGAVQIVSENPAKYVPVDPKIVLEVIARNTSSLCTDVTQRLETAVPQHKQDYVWLLKGEDNIHHRIGEIVAGAHKHVWIKAHEELLQAHLPALREACERGVQVLLVIFGEPEPEQRFNLGPSATIYLHEGNGVVVGLGNSLLTLTSDFEVALAANMADGGHGALAQNKLVVNLADSLLRHEIYLAEIFAHHGKEIDERFGPYLHNLRAKYFSTDQARVLEAMIAGAAEESAHVPASQPPAPRSALARKTPRRQKHG